MKKLTLVLASVLLVVMSAMTVFAAGINDSEQAVLDELRTSVTMNGTKLVFPADYVNQAETYYNTIDMTADESAEIVKIIKEGEKFLENSGANNIADLTVAQKKELFAFGEKVTAVIDCTVSYDKATNIFKVYDPDGKVIFSGEPKLVTVDTDADGNKTVAVADNSVIKTTGGFDYTGFAVAGAVFAVLVAGGVLFLVKTRKDRA